MFVCHSLVGCPVHVLRETKDDLDFTSHLALEHLYSPGGGGGGGCVSQDQELKPRLNSNSNSPNV